MRAENPDHALHAKFVPGTEGSGYRARSLYEGTRDVGGGETVAVELTAPTTLDVPAVDNTPRATLEECGTGVLYIGAFQRQSLEDRCTGGCVTAVGRCPQISFSSKSAVRCTSALNSRNVGVMPCAAYRPLA